MKRLIPVLLLAVILLCCAVNPYDWEDHSDWDYYRDMEDFMLDEYYEDFLEDEEYLYDYYDYPVPNLLKCDGSEVPLEVLCKAVSGEKLESVGYVYDEYAETWTKKSAESDNIVKLTDGVVTSFTVSFNQYDREDFSLIRDTILDADGDALSLSFNCSSAEDDYWCRNVLSFPFAQFSTDYENLDCYLNWIDPLSRFEYTCTVY